MLNIFATAAQKREQKLSKIISLFCYQLICLDALPPLMIIWKRISTNVKHPISKKLLTCHFFSVFRLFAASFISTSFVVYNYKNYLKSLKAQESLSPEDSSGATACFVLQTIALSIFYSDFYSCVLL